MNGAHRCPAIFTDYPRIAVHAHMACPPGTQLEFRVRHIGLKGRQLGSSNPNRQLSPVQRISREDDVTSVATLGHPMSDEDVIGATKALLSDLFVLFDFFQPADVVYREVVQNFIGGKTT